MNDMISIVIPAYNEEKNIRLGTLDKVSRYLENQTYSWEVILVDDGSSDETATLLKEYARANNNFRVIINPHQGKAATVITGIKNAKGGIVLFTDLDQATPINEITKVLPPFDNGFDIVIGSRNKEREGAPFLRAVMGKGFIVLRALILGLRGITDTQCGFKAFKKDVALTIFDRLKLYGDSKKVSGSMVTAGFDIEVLYIAKVLGYKVKEVAVEWHYVETRRVNPIRDSWQGLKDLIQIRMNSIRGEYNK